MHEPSDYYVRELKAARTFLDRWKGADGLLWEMTRSHRSLRIVLHRGEWGTRNLLIACLGPLRITGPVAWSDSDVEVSVVALPDGRQGYRVTDAGSGLDVLSESLEIAEHVKL